MQGQPSSAVTSVSTQATRACSPKCCWIHSHPLRTFIFRSQSRQDGQTPGLRQGRGLCPCLALRPSGSIPRGVGASPRGCRHQPQHQCPPLQPTSKARLRSGTVTGTSLSPCWQTLPWRLTNKNNYPGMPAESCRNPRRMYSVEKQNLKETFLLIEVT